MSLKHAIFGTVLIKMVSNYNAGEKKKALALWIMVQLSSTQAPTRKVWINFKTFPKF